MLRNNSVEFAVGSISRSTYLSEHLRDFDAEDWINSHTPASARVVVVGVSRAYYINRPYLGDWIRPRYTLLLAGGPPRAQEIKSWCSRGFRYILLDRAKNEFDDNLNSPTLPLSSFQWLRVFASPPRELYSAHGLVVLAVNPCALRE
jgi:hypothetical protein